MCLSIYPVLEIMKSYKYLSYITRIFNSSKVCNTERSCGSFQSPSECWRYPSSHHFDTYINIEHQTFIYNTAGSIHFHHDITIAGISSPSGLSWALQLYLWHKAKGNLKTLPGPHLPAIIHSSSGCIRHGKRTRSCCLS